MFRYWSLKWKFFSVFFVCVFLPILLFGTLIYQKANEAVQLQTVKSTEAALDKVAENLSSTMQSIEDITSYLIFSEDMRAYLQAGSSPDQINSLYPLEHRITGFAVFHLTSKPYLHSITVRSLLESRELHIGPSLQDTQKQKYEALAKKADGSPVWSESYSIQSYSYENVEHVVSLYRLIKDINNVNRRIGMATIRLNTKRLYQLVKTDALDGVGELFIVDTHGRIVLHPDENLIGTKNENSLVTEMADERTSAIRKQSTQQQLYITKQIPGIDWNVVARVDQAKVATGLSGVVNITQVMFIVTMALGILALIGFYYTTLRPIQLLTAQTKRVGAGDLSAKMPVRSNDEIGQMSQWFNHMTSQLRLLIDHKYVMEIKNREAELQLLQNQINPHFLYNTLDMIRWNARLENALGTSKLIEQLSKMFRISLSRGKTWISIKDELDYNGLYLTLQKKRLGRSFSYTIFYEHTAAQALVGKQSLQPLIENSIQHGFKLRKKPGHLYIRCFQEEGNLVIDVMDNGKGFEGEDFEKLKKSGYALKNLEERLQLAFKGHASLSLKKLEDGGAWVRIRHPFVTSEEKIEIFMKEEEANDS
ncbi:sensor histidine kinase [Aureibacillus halotolerans]|nr:sensor histidine kinase [Aureibacillus halotolerans]